MSEMIKLTLSLCLISAVATGVLGYAYEKTKAPIEAASAKQQADSLKQILPDFDNNPSKEMVEVTIDGRICKCLPATKDGKLIGVAVEAAAQGFGGDVKILVGFLADGGINQVVVSDHKETPGLGTVVTDRVKQKTIFDLFSPAKEDTGLAPSKFLDQFNKQTAQTGADLTVGAIDAVSGATVSSTAVTNAIAIACKAFNSFKEKQEVK